MSTSVEPDYWRENADGSLDYYDSRAGLYYPEDVPVPSQRKGVEEETTTLDSPLSPQERRGWP